MLQKIIKVGNSYAITIPKNFLKELGGFDQPVARVSLQANTKRVIVDFASEKVTEDVVDMEVYQVAKSLLKRYLPAFKELAKK